VRHMWHSRAEHQGPSRRDLPLAPQGAARGWQPTYLTRRPRPNHKCALKPMTLALGFIRSLPTSITFQGDGSSRAVAPNAGAPCGE
jgi:hypothetical protein